MCQYSGPVQTRLRLYAPGAPLVEERFHPGAGGFPLRVSVLLMRLAELDPRPTRCVRSRGYFFTFACEAMPAHRNPGPTASASKARGWSPTRSSQMNRSRRASARNHSGTRCRLRKRGQSQGRSPGFDRRGCETKFFIYLGCQCGNPASGPKAGCSSGQKGRCAGPKARNVIARAAVSPTSGGPVPSSHKPSKP